MPVPAPDHAHFSRPCHVDLELVSVAYRARSFPIHSHAEYVIGTVDSGAEYLDVGGNSHLVEPGDIFHLNPEQPHANAAVGSEILRYRVFYIPVSTVSSLLEDDNAALGFSQVKRHDIDKAGTLSALHRQLECGTGGKLEQETALFDLLGMVASDKGQPIELWPMPHAVAQARSYIEAYFDEGFGLAQLARIAGVSPYHLAHSFKRAIGMSPLAYRNQCRIREAARQVRSEQPLAEIAVALGFADQSHLTRQFQRLIGLSPARYRQQYRSSPLTDGKV
ncbi:MAG: AraC family transcriptional regulator [Sphingomonadaceae bacterium]